MQPTIITRLQSYRKRHELSYTEFGKLLEISKDTAFDLLNARRQYIDLNVLQRAQDLLETEEV